MRRLGNLSSLNRLSHWAPRGLICPFWHCSLIASLNFLPPPHNCRQHCSGLWFCICSFNFWLKTWLSIYLGAPAQTSCLSSMHAGKKIFALAYLKHPFCKWMLYHENETGMPWEIIKWNFERLLHAEIIHPGKRLSAVSLIYISDFPFFWLASICQSWAVILLCLSGGYDWILQSCTVQRCNRAACLKRSQPIASLHEPLLWLGLLLVRRHSQYSSWYPKVLISIWKHLNAHN